MNAKEKKELLTRLYRTTEFAQAAIEGQMDSLIKNGNTKEFDVTLLNLAEIAIKLLRGNY